MVSVLLVSLSLPLLVVVAVAYKVTRSLALSSLSGLFLELSVLGNLCHEWIVTLGRVFLEHHYFFKTEYQPTSRTSFYHAFGTVFNVLSFLQITLPQGAATIGPLVLLLFALHLCPRP